jgi:hypothetical protein
MAYNTGKPVPSRDPRDLIDNAESFDIRATSRDVRSTPDRLGVSRKTWYGMEQDFAEFLAASGFEPNHLAYQDGVALQVDRPTQLIDYSGSVYRVKMPASFPVMLSGTWATDSALLVQSQDQSLRQDLADSADPEKGAGMVAYKHPLVGAVARSLFNKSMETVSVLDFGAPGTIGVGNASADTAAFIAACSTGKANPVRVYIPAGTYRLNQAIDVHSYTSLIGAGRWQVDIICEHDGAVFNYLPGDNAPLNINQGGDNTVSGMSIRREVLPAARIPGNYGVKMPATFGMTVIEDLEFANMGDSNIYYEDIANPSVGSGPIFLRNIKMVSLWGWLVEFKNLFAQIYLDGLTSVRSGGGLYFDGSAGTATFRGFNLSIRNTNIESVGLGPGGTLAATPGPAIYVKRQHCVVIDNCYLSTHDNNSGPVVHLDDVTTADISASTAMVSHGDTGAGCLLLTGTCGRIDVGRSTLLEGMDKADYAIRSVGTTGLAIRNPRMTGFTGNQLELTGVGGSTPVLVESDRNVCILTQNYSGRLQDASAEHVQTRQLADQRGVAKALYLGAVSGGVLSVLTATGMSVTRTGAGVFAVTFSTARSDSVFIPEISVSSVSAMSVTYSNASPTGFTVRTFDNAGAAADPLRLAITVHADR